MVLQALSYVLPGWLIVTAVFGLMPFKPHGRIGMLLGGICIAAGLAALHTWQWRSLRRREEAFRRIFRRMEYP